MARRGMIYSILVEGTGSHGSQDWRVTGHKLSLEIRLVLAAASIWDCLVSTMTTQVMNGYLAFFFSIRAENILHKVLALNPQIQRFYN